MNSYIAACPFGQLPVLEWGDQQIAQSVAIARFVARQAGLTGKDALEDAKMDMLMDHISDHFNCKSVSI